MLRSGFRTLFCLLAGCSALALVAGNSDYGKYNYEVEGYLYNVGTHKFVGRGEVRGGNTYLKSVDDPKDAMLMFISQQFWNGSAFAMFVPVDGYSSKHHKKNEHTPFPGYVTFNQIGGWGNRKIGLEPDNQTVTHRFSISGAVYPKSEAFKIYINAKCLQIDENEDLAVEYCSRKGSRDEERQFWIWITKDRYHQDIERDKLYYEARPREKSDRTRREDRSDRWGEEHGRGSPYGRGGRYDGRDERDEGRRPPEPGRYEGDGGRRDRGNRPYDASNPNESCPGCGDNQTSPYVPSQGGKHPGDPKYYPYYSRGTCKYCDYYDNIDH